MSKKIRRAILITILVAVGLIGGTSIGVLIYLDARGLLGPMIQTLLGYFTFGGKSVLIIVWALILPLLLLAFLLFLVLRRRRVNKVKESWEEGLSVAIAAERAEYEESLKKQLPSRFDLTEAKPEAAAEGSAEVNTLGEFCTRFRNFSASRLGLYFTESEVREFVAGLATSKIIILQGVSGAGKTSLAYAFGEFTGNSSAIIPVQPMWKERSDLLGYYNEFTRKFNETPLFKKLYEANQSDNIYITVLDEMNIARVEYYFAEFLSLLEIPDPDMRRLEIVSDRWENDPAGLKDGTLKLPENMWFVGTVNDDDSAFPVSDKVYDRAMVVELKGLAEERAEASASGPVRVTYTQLCGMIQDAASDFALSGESLARIAALDKFLTEKFRITYGNRIKKQIRGYVAAYVACGGTESEALDDILAKKVLRKLAYRDLSGYGGELQELAALLENMPGGKMSRCCEYLGKISLYE